MPAAEMTAKLVPWGNSQAIRLTKDMTNPYDIEVGDELRAIFLPDGIKLMPKKETPRYRRAGHRTLEDIFAGYAGEPAGEEWLVGSVGGERVDE